MKNLKELLQEGKHALHEMRNGILYRKTNDGSLRFYVPEDVENHILCKYHGEMGHLGVDKVTERISKTYWFPKMRSKAAAHTTNCMNCIVYSGNHGMEEYFLHSIPKSSQIFDVVHVDHIEPIDKGSALKHILVVIDACTKFVRLYTTRTTNAKMFPTF